MPRESPVRRSLDEWAASLAARALPGTDAARRPGAPDFSQPDPLVERLAWGEADEHGCPRCEIVASHGEVQAEYAAIRRGAALFDQPHHATIEVTGAPADRRDFLNRMLTQEMKDLAPGVVKESFWLNRKGRIEADLLVVELGDRMLMDVDLHQAEAVVRTLGEFLFAEDVRLKDVSDHWHRMALHGRDAAAALADIAGRTPGELPAPMRAASMHAGDAEFVAARRDLLGEPGYELFVPMDQAERLVGRMRAQDRRRLRPIGWHAFNIARVESGVPMFNIDFGVNNLPHETGLLDRRVSFTKGCYLGQEIVARMQSLGRPKQVVVGLRVDGDALPVADAQVFAMTSADGAAALGEQVGVVTSSTLSPMLGAAPVAFAMVKSAHADLGGVLVVNAEGQQPRATVSALRFWTGVAASMAGSGAPSA